MTFVYTELDIGKLHVGIQNNGSPKPNNSRWSRFRSNWQDRSGRIDTANWGHIWPLFRESMLRLTWRSNNKIQSDNGNCALEISQISSCNSLRINLANSSKSLANSPLSIVCAYTVTECWVYSWITQWFIVSSNCLTTASVPSFKRSTQV